MLQSLKLFMAVKKWTKCSRIGSHLHHRQKNAILISLLTRMRLANPTIKAAELTSSLTLIVEIKQCGYWVDIYGWQC
jgi:hypothetical protein